MIGMKRTVVFEIPLFNSIRVHAISGKGAPYFKIACTLSGNSM